MRLEAGVFESTEETKQGEVYWELEEAKNKLDFNLVQYEVELNAIERRKKLLQWALEIQIPLIVIFIGLVLLFSMNLAFGFWASLLCIGIILYLLYSSFRILISYLRHIAKIPADNIYTLAQEKNDVLAEMGRVREAIHKIDLVLAQKRTIWNPNEPEELTAARLREEAFEEQGRKCLDEISYELTFKERRADYLYGERVK